jgi:sugar lactone lactonase YvrE
MLAGCAATAPPSETDPELFWPKPPATERIRFVRSVSEPSDIDIRPGTLGRFVRYMAGTPKASIVSPYGVAADEKGRLFVVDTYRKRVHRFHPGKNAYSCFPEEPKVLDAPVGIALDEKGRIYVTDTEQGVVKVFADGGEEVVAELGADFFERPTGICVNPHTAELAVVDTLASRVFRFDLFDFSLKGSFGANGASEGEFHYPTNICSTPDGNFAVSDTLNFRIQVFSPEGAYLYKFGGMGRSAGSFSRPKGIAADSDGNLYVVDALFDNIQVFDPRGRLLMAFGTHGREPGEFWLPTGICIDAHDRIHVSDASNSRIQVFQYLKRDGNQ